MLRHFGKYIGLTVSALFLSAAQSVALPAALEASPDAVHRVSLTPALPLAAQSFERTRNDPVLILAQKKPKKPSVTRRLFLPQTFNPQPQPVKKPDKKKPRFIVGVFR